MRLIITSLILLLCSGSVAAQSLKVTQSDQAKESLTKINSQKSSTKVNGYRIGIFFDNGQDARSKATEAKAKFKESFPTEPIYMLYESPYYKVSVGNCHTDEEAIMLFEKVRRLFPDAFMMRETMEIGLFVKEKRERPIASEVPENPIPSSPI